MNDGASNDASMPSLVAKNNRNRKSSLRYNINVTEFVGQTYRNGNVGSSDSAASMVYNESGLPFIGRSNNADDVSFVFDTPFVLLSTIASKVLLLLDFSLSVCFDWHQISASSFVAIDIKIQRYMPQ
ncbi:uncharacterized protein [Rutidosis leptorrhynchoides]|uniref:uncharacterized protein n=1 Tax=Rutidosis leptorrhynchoides TaxID=125765 RepID=UPI003A9957D1